MNNIVNPAVKTKFSTTATQKKSPPNKCNAGGQAKINMVAETGNANIFGTVSVADRIAIPTANLLFNCSELEAAVSRLLSRRPTTKNVKMTANTGNTGNMTASQF